MVCVVMRSMGNESDYLDLMRKPGAGRVGGCFLFSLVAGLYGVMGG